MREIAQSSLSDIKSVFNSADDNVHYFRVLENSIGSKIGAIHFAQPIVYASSGSIRWRANIEGDLVPYNQLNRDAQNQVAKTLQEGYRILETRFKSFRNVPEGFHNRIMDIPGFESILVKSSGFQEIVLINWGFVEDKLERKEGLLQSLFPAPDCSILARLTSAGGIPASGEEIHLTSQNISRSSTTDQNGLARLGNLPRGSSFRLSSPNAAFENSDFVSEENAEYRLTLLRKINLSFRIVDSQKIPFSNREWTFAYSGGTPLTIISDEKGEFSLSIADIGYEYAINNDSRKTIYNGRSGQSDEFIEIILDEDQSQEENRPSEEPFDPPVLDPIVPFVIRFIEKSGKGIANLPFELHHNVDGKQNHVTDTEGKVLIVPLDVNQNYRTNFRYKNKELVYDFINPPGSTGHTFILKVRFPWFWWLLCALLLALLIWCFLSEACWCNYTHDTVQREITAPAVEVQPCNQQVASGGAGVTENVHELGNKPGTVVLNYDMANVPDYLEIFYLDSLVASTREIPGNENGYVGGNNTAGQYGEISFYYEASGSTQCLVRVTGPDSTQWHYLLGCPKMQIPTQ